MRFAKNCLRRVPILTIACALVFAPALLRAGMNQWSGGRPAGTFWASIVAADPQDPYVVYAVFSGNLHRSPDGGRTWTHMSSLYYNDFGALLVHPAVPSTLYLGARVDDGSDNYSGVLKSTDRGLTWTRTGIPEYASVLTASPTGSTLFAANYWGAAYKSVDGGDTWSATGRPSAKLLSTIEALVIDPTNDANVYAGGNEWEYETSSYYPSPYPVLTAPILSKSTNRGATWTDLSAAVGAGPKIFVTSIAIDPGNPSKLYLGLRGATGEDRSMLRSTTDAGASWAPAGNGLPDTGVLSLVIDPQRSSTLYAGTHWGIYRTRDGGASWSPFSQQLVGSYIYSLALGRGGRFLHTATFQGAFDLEIGSGALDVSSGAAGQSRVLFWDADRLSVRTLGGSGSWESTPSEGPYSAWNATAIADGADGLSRVLWQNGDGRVGLEYVGSAGNLGAVRFAAQAGWTATDVSVGSDGRTHLLWTSADGQMRIASMNSSGSATEGPAYGPYGGWSARAIADAPDGATWVLWRHTTGRAAIARYRDGTSEEVFRWGANPGWAVEDLAVGADGVPRVLWTNPDGRMEVTSVDSQGQLFDRKTYSSAGQQARRIAGSPDGLMRVLWTATDGSGLLWILNPDNSVESQHPIPTPGSETPQGGPAAGLWTGTYEPAYAYCDYWGYGEHSANGSASASFEQYGSTVIGALSSSGVCSFSVAFNGTLQGASLEGTITGPPFSEASTARGTLSGTRLDLTLTDPSAAAGGQLHLQRE